MKIEARKISFEDAWNSMSVFFVDDILEAEIDQEVDQLLELALDANLIERDYLDADSIASELNNNPRILEIILGLLLSSDAIITQEFSK